MTDDFDIDAVRIMHMGGMVSVVTAGPDARRSMVGCTGIQGGFMEGVDERAAVGMECDMGRSGAAPALLLPGPEPYRSCRHLLEAE